MRLPTRLVLASTLLFAAFALQGCGLLVAGGAGAAAGYEAKEHGYEPQSPITHDESEDETD
ncbi:MAG TPA: hypothetical protein VK110_00435 [Salinisphaeraceae bacterium]|nr:hypothetical protein [Salinisphaeraceae bacterium]